MKIAAGFIAAGLAGSVLFLWIADQRALIEEAADPTDSLERTIAGLPPLPQPWYMTHRVELVVGVMVIAALLGLLTAIVVRVER